MNMDNLMIKSCIALGCIFGFLGACSYINKNLGLEDDNIIEEVFEGVIKHETGIDVDLSPED